jgi:hypothetical protein
MKRVPVVNGESSDESGTPPAWGAVFVSTETDGARFMAGAFLSRHGCFDRAIRRHS